MNKIEKLLDYLQQSPDDCFLKHALALEYLKEKNEKVALKYFEENLEYNPNYIGTYYHLAKLYEQTGATEKAKITYETGMLKAKEAGDLHAYNELNSAYEDLID
jgi:Tfp pilus assembly protein PilF